jgi:hypothetical protein
VLSTQHSERCVQPAIALIKKGFYVYIDRVKVKGKGWMRLRAGFFKDREKADLVAKAIKTILNVKDAWVAKAENEELEKFGGY